MTMLVGLPVPLEIESAEEIEKVIALFEKVDLEHNGRVNKGEQLKSGGLEADIHLLRPQRNSRLCWRNCTKADQQP